MLFAILAEIVLSALIAPVMMVFQTRAVAAILAGHDAGWQVQRRSDGAISRSEIYRIFTVPTLCGLVMALAAYSVAVPLLFWMSPVIIGLVLGIPIGVLTSGRSRGWHRTSAGPIVSSPSWSATEVLIVNCSFR